MDTRGTLVRFGLVRGVGASLFTALLACASSSGSSGSSGGARHVHMDPLVIRDKADPLTGLDGYDAGQLMEKGNELYRSQDFDRALKVFGRLIEVFPDSELVPLAQFNAGLCSEALIEYGAAALRFEKVVTDTRTPAETLKDAQFRRAFVLSKLERWKEVGDTFWAIRQLVGLTTMDELEARVGQGVAMFMLGDHVTAEHEFMLALDFHDKKKADEYLPAEYFLGQARFYLGEISARAFEGAPLSEPKLDENAWAEMMGEELEKKCELLLRAQNNFIRAIRAGHRGWATASGYRIGSLYERLYDDLLKIPVPQGLDEEARAYYVKELRERIGVLVVKAIKVYELSLETAERVGENNEWVERTAKSLERMKSLYLDTMEG